MKKKNHLRVMDHLIMSPGLVTSLIGSVTLAREFPYFFFPHGYHFIAVVQHRKHFLTCSLDFVL